MVVTLGENIPLSTKLDPVRDDRFVQCIITKGTQTLSTINLTSIGNGKYRNDSYAPNETGIIEAEYTVYRDSGYTQRDSKYLIRTQIIRVENFIEALQGTIDDSDGAAV